MSGAAAPAPPTLAAERPRAARERPLTAQRAHLAPSDRRQPLARFREAPTMYQQCTHAVVRMLNQGTMPRRPTDVRTNERACSLSSRRSSSQVTLLGPTGLFVCHPSESART